MNFFSHTTDPTNWGPWSSLAMCLETQLHITPLLYSNRLSSPKIPTIAFSSVGVSSFTRIEVCNLRQERYHISKDNPHPKVMRGNSVRERDALHLHYPELDTRRCPLIKSVLTPGHCERNLYEFKEKGIKESASSVVWR